MGCGSSKVGVGVDQVDQGAKGGYVAPRGLALPKKKEHELGRIKRVVKGTYDRDTKYKPFKEGVPLDEVEAPGHAHIIVYLPCKDKGALDGKSKGYDALWKRGTPINDCFKGDDIQIEGRLVRAHCKEVWAAFQQIYRVPITPRVFVSDPESPSREYQLSSKGKSSGFFRDQQGKAAWANRHPSRPPAPLGPTSMSPYLNFSSTSTNIIMWCIISTKKTFWENHQI